MQGAPFLPPGQVGFSLAAVLDRQACAQLRERLQTLGYLPTAERYPAAYRNNDRLVFDDAALAERLFSQLAAALPAELTQDGGTWQLAGLNSRFRACRYRDGQAFCIHRDGAHVRDADTRSLLTLQLYLDDAEAMIGGHTRFYADRHGQVLWAAVPPRCGTAIVFDHRVWHDGEAVTGGAKQVLRTDVMYRRISGASAGAELPELGRHQGYAWRVIALRGAQAPAALASAGRDGAVRLWRRGAAPGVHQVAEGSVTALAESDDGALWCGTRAGELLRLTSPGQPGAAIQVVQRELGAVLALAARGPGVVAATASGQLVELTAPDATPRVTARHAGWAWAVLADGAALWSCGADGVVRDGARVLARLGAAARTLTAAAGPGSAGALLVGAEDGQLHQLQPRASGGAPTTSWRAHDAAVTGLATSARGEVASCSEDGTVKLWRGSALVWSSAPRPDFITSVAFAADGALFATGYDGAVFQVQ